ncbi:MAG TPA: hypothetical protein PK854_00630 [Oscillospiraceae bacterium]|nr:hypothetical protein [Oscillospiraceae bacterium]HPS33758.1 hypothetical protein [Oscillospiraceae bacterium]
MMIKRAVLLLSVTLMVFLTSCENKNITIEKRYEIPISGNTRSIKNFVDSNGELYTWGFDNYLGGESSKSTSGSLANVSSLGQGDVLYNNSPTRIYSNIKTLYMTRAVTWDYKMLEWGFRSDKKATTPKVVRDDVSYIFENFYITSSGDLYSYIMFDDHSNEKNYETGDVLIDTGVVDLESVAYGIDNNGFIGLKKDGSVWVYTFYYGDLKNKFKVAEGVKQMYTGYLASGTVFLLKKDGSLWSFGNNEFGQCGNGEYGDLNLSTIDCVVSEPYKVLENVKNMYYSRWRAAYAVTENGDLYGWGCNDCDLFLQGGEKTMHSDSIHSIFTTPVLIMSGVKEVIYSGNFNTACLIIKKDNSLWAWGTNAYGELGNGTLPKVENYGPAALSELLIEYKAEFFEPIKILDGVKRYVGCQDYLQFVEMLDGRIMYWGLDYLVVDEEDDWDFQSSWNDLLFEKHYIIPIPIEFTVDTYFQTALDYIAAQSGVDVSQYEAAHYINDQN